MALMFGFLPRGTEWIWILLIIVILFGGKKLPDLARGLGKSVSEFKKGKEEGLSAEAKAETVKPVSDPSKN
jgi:TatA/E family protein of Tat protein translocase